jgi:hypothetical protein
VTWQNKALDAEPPIASFLTSMLIGGGPVNANVLSLGLGKMDRLASNRLERSQLTCLLWRN